MYVYVCMHGTYIYIYIYDIYGIYICVYIYIYKIYSVCVYISMRFVCVYIYTTTIPIIKQRTYPRIVTITQHSSIMLATQCHNPTLWGWLKSHPSIYVYDDFGDGLWHWVYQQNPWHVREIPSHHPFSLINHNFSWSNHHYPIPSGNLTIAIENGHL